MKEYIKPEIEIITINDEVELLFSSRTGPIVPGVWD